MDEVLTEVLGKAGCITLNRPTALNALSLRMIRAITAELLAWRNDRRVEIVCIRGVDKDGPFGTFCAGGDIRFFHQAALTGDPRLEDFFTEEYTLDHLVHAYPKPVVAFLDGLVLGGGMGIGQGARHRVVTERTKMAMPETNIGLFPDVGGGYFLSRCPGRVGEYLALTGATISGADAVAVGLADMEMASTELPALWESLAREGAGAVPSAKAAAGSSLARHRAAIDHVFALQGVAEIVGALEAGTTAWSRDTAALLRRRSPLMLHVALEQVRRGRGMSLADTLRMERDLVHRCFHLRPGTASETVEGIRALAVDKDNVPRWNPPCVEAVTQEMVAAFFHSPWPAHAHPLRGLA